MSNGTRRNGNTVLDRFFHINMALVLLTFILKLLFLIFLIILPFLYDLSAKFRYYFKFFVFKAIITCVNIVFVPFAICRPLHFTNASVIGRLFSFISRVLNIRWSIIGVENLKLNESCVLVANHQSHLDVLGVSEIYAHLETACVALAKNDFIYAGFFGLTSLNRFSLINESDEILSHKNLLPSRIKQLKHDNVSILIFPELSSNRRHEGIYDFQRSAFILAIKEQLPIVPVVFSNYYFIDNHHKIFDPGYITIEVISPIKTDKLSTDDVSMLIEETASKMRSTLKNLSGKLTPPSIEELRRQYVL